VPDFSLEQTAGGIVAGIDEAGRGPLAGPVVAAAVSFRGCALPSTISTLIDDSKKLSPAKRQAAYRQIIRVADYGVGIADVQEIDTINILQATMTAMQRAVARLSDRPDLALVDGNRAPVLPCATQTVVKGDSRSLSIAAASIVAKVTRDTIMADLDKAHPGYGWAKNAGYGVPTHLAALRRLGPTKHHRRSFAPIRILLLNGKNAPQDID